MGSKHAWTTIVACTVASLLTTTAASAEDRPPTPGRDTAHRRKAAAQPPAVDETATPGKQHGNASFYAKHLDGRRTASGEAYDPGAMTAAHRTLPLGTKLKVVNPKNDRSVVVTVNDRGPMHKGRMLDVSSAAADQLGMKQSGVTRVETQVVAKPADGDATAR